MPGPSVSQSLHHPSDMPTRLVVAKAAWCPALRGLEVLSKYQQTACCKCGLAFRKVIYEKVLQKFQQAAC